MSGSHPESALPSRSPWLLRLFSAWLGGYLARRFHGVRLLGSMPELPEGPVLVVMNHPSWWDPLIALVLAQRLGRPAYAPMEAEALGRYGFFGKLGMFPLERGSVGGHRRFLRSVDAVLGAPGAVLWITAQGTFADARQRPAGLEAGVGHVARRMRGGTVLPLALEYTFWDESRPEALVAFGPPIPIADGRTQAASEWTERFGFALEQSQDRLAEAAMARDPRRFTALIDGSGGVGGIYDLGRRLLASMRGERFSAAHSPTPERP